MKDKEIELKFIINKDIKERIIADLNYNKTPCSTLKLKDTYYTPTPDTFEINGETVECLRIRETEGSIIFSYKKIHKDCTPIYCDEYETEVLNKEQLEKILFALGYKIQMIIDKTRLTYVTETFEFAFDSVKGLDELLEIELKNEQEDLNSIYNFVAKYNLTKNNVTYEGIQNMMKKKNNKH